MSEHYATTTADGTEMVEGKKVYFCHKCSAPFQEWTDNWDNRVRFPCLPLLESKGLISGRH